MQELAGTDYRREVVELARIVTLEQIEAMKYYARILRRRRKNRETNQQKADFLTCLVEDLEELRL